MSRKGSRLRSRLALCLVVAATFAGGFAASNSAPSASAVPVAVERTCGHGYAHAVIGGEEKCLRAGQFCARRYDAQYRRYGFRCIKYDSRVHRYRLTHA